MFLCSAARYAPRRPGNQYNTNTRTGSPTVICRRNLFLRPLNTGCFFFPQDKVYDEIYSVLGDSDRDVTPDDISSFKYLEMVLKETLRLFPPGAIFSRKINENVKLSECAPRRYNNIILMVIRRKKLGDKVCVFERLLHVRGVNCNVMTCSYHA